MRRLALVFLLGAAFCCRTAYADMIEVKAQGFLNGKVTSKNDKEIHFTDAKGKAHIFPKQDVLYMELESNSGGVKEISNGFKEKTEQAMKAGKKAFKELKEKSAAATEKLTGEISKPLDRSQADSRAGMLNAALDQAGQASAALAKKNMAVNREIKKQEGEYGGEEQQDSHKGHFSKL